MKLQEIVAAIQEYHPEADLEAVRSAFAFARKHHEGQTRASGEPYITHVTEVAYLIAKLKLDVSSIVAALLHDTVEDTPVTIEQLEREFGKEVSELVDGVTKLSQVKFSSRAEAQAENFRKMLLAMARDIRVLLIKLCDRLHNMRTLEYVSEARQARIAQETLDIYAPLSHRLGIFWMKSELEDLSLRYLKPEIYNGIKSQVRASKRERESYIDSVVRLIRTELEQNEIAGDVSGRPKHFFSIYEKMEAQGIQFHEIHDLIAFRILVPTAMDCYAALGAVHAAWKPIPGRFKDFIAMPKPNRYQSLHTTVIGPQGARIEIQIRTPAMHDIAERGIAAHWIYKQGNRSEQPQARVTQQFPWLKDLLESEQALRDPHEFMSLVKDDLFSQEVYAFSPKGDLCALSRGATPIDFAYHIHSEVGHHCTGARVNGQQVPLSYKLRNGDTIEVTTSPHQVPSKDWLNLVVTSKAKQRIRAWIKGEERSRSIALAKEMITKDLRKVKLSLQKVLKDGSLKKIADKMGYRDTDLLLAEIGYGKLSTAQVVRELAPEEAKPETFLSDAELTLQKINQKSAKPPNESSGVKVHGFEDFMFKFAKCCEPLPGDELVGYISQGRGLIIHSRACQQILQYDQRRFIPVSWDEGTKTMRQVGLQVLSTDTMGILAAMTNAISNSGANIVKASINSTTDGRAINNFDVTVGSVEQLSALIRAVERLPGVLRVNRTKREGEEAGPDKS